MFDEIDRAYFARRAAQERVQAQRAINASVARIHLELAEEYERKAALHVSASQALMA